MIRILAVILMVWLTQATHAQSEGVNPGDSSSDQKYANFDFRGHFASGIGRYEANNYFLLDFTKLPSRFERVYFMNLSFSENRIVNIDPDIAKNRIRFMANTKYDAAEITEIFEGLKDKTLKVATTWSVEEKYSWLQKNDKYK